MLVVAPKCSDSRFLSSLTCHAGMFLSLDPRVQLCICSHKYQHPLIDLQSTGCAMQGNIALLGAQYIFGKVVVL